jgi:hypothetical protein
MSGWQPESHPAAAGTLTRRDVSASDPGGTLGKHAVTIE